MTIEQAEHVTEGDVLYVIPDLFLHGGKCGEVLSTNAKGVGLWIWDYPIPNHLFFEWWEIADKED